jgi:hypothetical protein
MLRHPAALNLTSSAARLAAPISGVSVPAILLKSEVCPSLNKRFY